ncbi:uncharacterized protein PG986_007981 [Apiospora aurea]|uniref:P-loop containing nucleoside triphosphate hydrolase protein n=1 Tax=Apiospora aurea TaxID=335848 RepID=A0ABR1QE59_9PEZI
MATKNTQPSRELLRWYRKCSPHRLDLIGDFAGKELFAVDANSLLLHCVTQANVDFTDGFQLLHAVYAVEIFLRRLHQRGCNFHLVFFRKYVEMSIPPGTSKENTNKYLLASQVLFHHLQHHSDDSENEPQRAFVYEFSGPDASAFKEYVKANAALKLDIKVALLNDLEIRNNKMFASVISPTDHDNPAFNIKLEDYKGPDVPGDSSVNEKLEAKLEGYSVREKISTAAICQLVSKDSSNSLKMEVVALTLHLMGMRHWALTERPCKAILSKRPAPLEDFLEKITIILACVSPTSWLFQGTWDLSDLFDGRVFLSVYTGVRNKRAFPETLVQETRALLRVIEDTTEAKLLRHLPPVLSVSEDESVVPAPSSLEYAMLPFSHPIIDQYLAAVNLDIDAAFVGDNSNQVFKEILHWHNANSSLKHKHGPKPLRFFAHKRNQILMDDIMNYSASLTNSTGKAINPETIVVQQDHRPMKPSKAHPRTAKKAKAESKEKLKTEKLPRANGTQRALDAANATRERKGQAKTDSVLTGWADRWREDFDVEKSLIRRHRLVLIYLGNLRKQDYDVVGPEVLLYICIILCQMWTELVQRNPTHNQNATGMQIAGLIYHHSTTIAQLPGCTIQISDAVQHLAKLLRLPEIPMAESFKNSRPLVFKVHQFEDLRLPLAAVEFQLQYCGPYLERSFDSRKDERVSFSPDAWQRDVLDAIDAEKSLLVIAPTSAGKTFISFYAMKKVLQVDDDGVIVYVAPTKALVNQIAAEIHARFSKSYKHSNGWSVWAIHTRDYRVNNPTGCQILVTVPHILQIMLLSPANNRTKNSWSRRVRRIIFDEVHCIGQSEEGVVWEQLNLTAPCPIIALSATVGNPETFHEWLKVTQEQHGRSLYVIKHDSRYSDLRKYIYAKPTTFEFTGLKTVDHLPTPGLHDTSKEPAFRHIHPVAALQPGYFSMIRANPFFCRDDQALDDINLEPQDCLALWKAMAKANVKNSQSLNPIKILTGLTSKAQVVLWEKRLKHMLSHLMATDGGALRRNPFKQDEDTQSEQAHTIALPLLSDLHSHDGLPAIIFNHERYECEQILGNVFEKLKDSELCYKNSNPEWKEQMRQYKLWKQTKALKKAAVKHDESRKKPKVRAEKEPAKILEGQRRRELDRINLSRWSSFDPAAPLDEFSFADKTKLGNSELEKLLKPLKDTGVFIDALRRGIGVHHAGMNRQYRQVVEILFRKGFLRVVIATGTLALGINMPCRTVVFMGDSVFHTALNYRQASGRAGRRGFDLLGNVVFAGIKPQRVFEMMSSKLPDLRGQFALSTTLVLRVLGLLHATDNTAYAVSITKSLLTHNQLFLGGPESKLFVQHHLRFSIEYLRRERLLSKKGAPINFAGLVGHLYFTENAAFAFHALLKGGYFHNLCANIYSKRDKVLEELALVMAHLFLRVQCTNAVKMSISHGDVSPSVLLPNLPTSAEEILKEHNRHILSIFTSYATSFARMHLQDVPDRVLPYTQHAVGPEQSGGYGSLDKLPPCFLRSPFAALSGHDDTFSSIQDLCNNVRSGVFMEKSAIPSLPIAPHDTDGPLNGYLFNFYKHGDMEALKGSNKIRRGSVYIILKDYILILSTIVASLKNYTSTDAMVDDEDIIGVYDDEKDSTEKRDDTKGRGSGCSGNRASLPSWANAQHGTLEHVQKAFAMLLEEYDNKLRKTKS